jgi:peptide/nickel transport system substrate-binding protein
MTWRLVGAILALAAGTGEAQTVDGTVVDPDAELVVAVPDDTTNMDPRIGMGSTRSNYIRQVFESLVDVDAQGKPVPGLALSWKPVGDLAWEFTLRRGVTFHNGEAFNADTVLFNLDRMFRRGLDRWGIKDVTAGTSFEKVYSTVARWEKTGDYTVRIYTSEPVPNLWDFIGREPLVPREYTVKNGVEGLNERPVGTGSWKMAGWKRGDSMRFERYEGYWGPPPLFKRLRFQVIPEAGARLAALRAGQVTLVDAVPPLARPKDKFDSGGRDGLFTDPRVRLALNLAVNKDGIVQKIFHGYAQANASPVSTVSSGYAAQEPYAYDVKRARVLLAEAGWKDAGPDGVLKPDAVLKKDGETLTLQLLFPVKHYGQAFDETTAAVAEMLKAVGVQVVIKPIDFGTLLQTVTKGTLPYNGGFSSCRTSNNLDADDYLRDWTAITLINWSPYPADLADLYRATRREVDPQKRLKLLAELQRRVRDWAPVVSLYQEVKIYAASARVLRFVPLTDLHMDFRGVALRK